MLVGLCVLVAEKTVQYFFYSTHRALVESLCRLKCDYRVHPATPEAASLGRCGLSQLSAQKILWGLQLTFAKMQGGEGIRFSSSSSSITWQNSTDENQLEEHWNKERTLAGPGRATEKEHPWSIQESQQLLYSSALSLVELIYTHIGSIQKYALLWLSSSLQLFCCTSKCRTTRAFIPAFLVVNSQGN